MPTQEILKIRTNRKNVFLRVCKGHFATSHSHINHYIDITIQKSRLSEAQALARELVSFYNSNTIVDTIICLDGTEVIGTCMAEELTKGGFSSINAHQTIYVVTPERTSGSQIIFRDNVAPMVNGKNILILAASVATGYTAQAAIEAINYYGGIVAGISAIFATVDEVMNYPVRSVFNPNDLEGYASYSPHECPMCKSGHKIDALVNSFGFSKL